MTSANEKFAEPICICMGEIVPLRQLVVPATDAGFIHGVTVSEQVRTFAGQPFLLDKHHQRWCRGLETLQLSPPCDIVSLRASLQQLLDHNAGLLPGRSERFPGSTEQGICFYATPGEIDLGWNLPRRKGVTFSAYTYPLAVDQHRQHYQNGVHLVTTSIREVPSVCWPNSVKIRSRLHYYLAQQQARAISTDAFPILLDQQENVSDSAIASIAGWTQEEGLVVRPPDQRYSSVTIEFVVELARQLQIPVTERKFSVAELQSFPESFLVSTPWCIYPVRRIDEQQLAGSSKGFPVFSKLLGAWESLVSVRQQTYNNVNQ